MAVAIFNAGIIQVDTFRNNAFFNQGKNVSNGWSYIAKTNLSVGEISGKLNWVPSGANIINDPDLRDGPTSATIGSNSPTAGSNLEGF